MPAYYGHECLYTFFIKNNQNFHTYSNKINAATNIYNIEVGYVFI